MGLDLVEQLELLMLRLLQIVIVQMTLQMSSVDEMDRLRVFDVHLIRVPVGESAVEKVVTMENAVDFLGLNANVVRMRESVILLKES